jgi:hypothetical protein
METYPEPKDPIYHLYIDDVLYTKRITRRYT